MKWQPRHENIVHAAIGIAADNEAAMCTVYRTTGDEDIFQGGSV
jgi:hypothetical protein